jgi:hypothetical protein
MLYSYTITQNFFNNLALLDPISQHKICDFIRYNFIHKENLYLKLDRNILTKKYGTQDNSEFKELLKSLSNEIKDALADKVIPVDLALCTGKDKYFPIKISCDLILKNTKKVKKYIDDLCTSFWPKAQKDKSIETLEFFFKRILDFNSNILINYRYLLAPQIELHELKEQAKNGGKDKTFSRRKQIEEMDLFLKFILRLRNKNNNKIKIYTIIDNNKLKIIENYKLDLKNEVKKLADFYLKKKDQILIKEYSYNLWSLFHDRYIITFLDEDTEGKFLDDDLNVFEFNGMDFFESKNTIKSSKKISRHSREGAFSIWESYAKLAHKTPNLVEIEA